VLPVHGTFATDSLSLGKLSETYRIIPGLPAIFTHILPFYNKGVCRTPNVGAKMEQILKKVKKDEETVFRSQKAGFRMKKSEGLSH